MLTVMCPNCRHRFPAPGCCESDIVQKTADGGSSSSFVHPTACYYGGLLVPRGYTSGGGCFINAPIVHGQPIVQPLNSSTAMMIDLENDSRILLGQGSSVVHGKGHVTTSCDLTGGSVTITTPNIQSGGSLIQSPDSGLLMQAPNVEISPKLSGGGCFVQKRLSDGHEASILLPESKHEEEHDFEPTMFPFPPSGCQELPGIRRNSTNPEDKLGGVEPRRHEEGPVLSSFQITSMPVVQLKNHKENESSEAERNSSCCCSNVQNLYHVRPASSLSMAENRDSVLLDPSPGVQIQVNATVQLPASLGQCTVNITATTTNPLSSLAATNSRSRNNFNGGGLVQENISQDDPAEERRERPPSTPVSWLMPCPWSFDSYLMDKDVSRLCEVKRLLQTCGWYHEGLSWQQSESLLKHTAVGRWLMRDSSDSRYTFAVSVQTARGPTSVRVHYFLGRFRLDAEPRLAFAMPLFDCPIKMLEYYIEYSKSVDEHRKEVWVDYSGKLYSEIYLTRPLIKEVRSLSHLSRLVVNRSKLPTQHLPPLIRNYLAEYPYTL